MPTALFYDVGLDEDNDLPARTQHISGFELVVQRIRRRLQTVKGEWLGDVAVGLPFFEWFQQKPPQVDAIGALIRAAIESTPGVARLADWAGELDVDTRALTFGGTIHTSDGDATIVVRPLMDPRGGNVNSALRLVIGGRGIAPRA